MPRKSTSPASSNTTLQPGSRAKFLRQLGITSVTTNYFRRHLRQFFPSAASLLEVAYTHKPTLSTSSYLTKFDVAVSVGGHRVVKRVRGNTVDRGTYTIFARVAQHPQHVIRFPRPLAFFTPPNYILYEEVGGTTLRQKSFSGALWPLAMRKIGLALATFQRTPSRGLRRLSWTDERRFLRQTERTITRLAPERRDWIRQVMTVLQPREAKAWPHHQGLVHKDFQASNIITGPRVGIIDFTLSGVGPMAFDVGTFLAHLTVMTHNQVSPARTQLWRRTFVRSYRAVVGPRQWRMMASQIAVFELRAAIDILAITLTTLGEQQEPGKMYVALLVNEIDRLVQQIA